MPSYKLSYFQARGAAEPCRLLFAAAGKEFEDVRYSREEWPNHKEEMPLKAMPVLEVDGETFCQSNAIARHLAREFGMYGDNNMEALRIDVIHETIVELTQAFMKVYYAPTDEDKAKLLGPFLEETVPKIMTFLQRQLCENNDGNGYMVGSKLSLADIVVYYIVFSLNLVLTKFHKGKEIDVVEKTPKLKDLVDRIAAEPKIAEWLKKRPVTEM